MNEFQDQEFFFVVDRGGNEFESLRFCGCQFVNCGFSLSDDVAVQSLAKDVELVDCHVCNGLVGPGIVENVTINGLTSDGVITCYATFFRHTVIRGKVGRISIASQASPTILKANVQQNFDRRRIAHYEATDWALDISEAEFEELDIVGVPAETIRIDSSRHFVLKRKNALRENWRSKTSSRSDYWVYVIDEFLNDGDESTVLVIPKCGSKKESNNMTDGLLELRDLGVVY